MRLFASGLAEKNRVEAFSDGVIAIVITLLVLEIKVPQHVTGGDQALWHAIGERLPMIGAWVVSFVFVLVFWVAHHYLFMQMRRIDRGLLWLNGLFLLSISFTPFPTALVGEYPGAAPSVFVLSAAMFLTACSFTAMRVYVLRRASDLIERPQRHLLLAALRRSLIAPAAYAFAMGMAFLWIPAALVIQALVPLWFFIPSPRAED